MFCLSPVIRLSVVLLLWQLIPFKEGRVVFKYSLFIFLGFIRLEVYPLFIAEWSSNNKYRTLGAIRGIVQTLSFEINFSLLFFIIVLLRINSSWRGILKINSKLLLIVYLINVFILIFILLVIDSNRTPFDFSEGESELVSGFNTEYRGGVFVLIFLAEYAKILLFRIMLVRLVLVRRRSFFISYILLGLIRRI